MSERAVPAFHTAIARSSFADDVGAAARGQETKLAAVAVRKSRFLTPPQLGTANWGQ